EPAERGAWAARWDKRRVAGGRRLRSVRGPELGDQVLRGRADAARGHRDSRPRWGITSFRACVAPVAPSGASATEPPAWRHVQGGEGRSPARKRLKAAKP